MQRGAEGRKGGKKRTRDRYSIQGESCVEELDSRIFFASVTRRPSPRPSNQSTGPQSNSRRFTEIMDGRKQLDPRQRTPNKYRSDEIEDTQRNRDEERGKRIPWSGGQTRKNNSVLGNVLLSSPPLLDILSPFFSFFPSFSFYLLFFLPCSCASLIKPRFVLKGTTHN